MGVESKSFFYIFGVILGAVCKGRIKDLPDKIRRIRGKGQGKTLSDMAPVGPGIDMITVSKEEVLAGDTSAVETGLNVAIQATKNTKEIPTRLIIFIAGYNQDRREIWEIPEVISWYAKLDPKIAYWLDDLAIPVYLKVCAASLNDSMVRRIFAWSPETLNILPPYTDGHRELAMVTLVYAKGNMFCEKLFGPNTKAAKHVIELASDRISHSLTGKKLTEVAEWGISTGMLSDKAQPIAKSTQQRKEEIRRRLEQTGMNGPIGKLP